MHIPLLKYTHTKRLESVATLLITSNPDSLPNQYRPRPHVYSITIKLITTYVTSCYQRKQKQNTGLLRQRTVLRQTFSPVTK